MNDSDLLLLVPKKLERALRAEGGKGLLSEKGLKAKPCSSAASCGLSWGQPWAERVWALPGRTVAPRGLGSRDSPMALPVMPEAHLPGCWLSGQQGREQLGLAGGCRWPGLGWEPAQITF